MALPTINPTEANESPVVYLESDGKPIAEDTLQFQWIETIKGGLEAFFKDDPNVFIAADLLWQPVEGRPDISMAPDALVAFGRPKGYRGSYKQWEEAHIAPQVVFEILSPSNRPGEMVAKAVFYERYGVEEYYLYDPHHNGFDAFVRSSGTSNPLNQITIPAHGFTSPSLGIRFDVSGKELVIYKPNGERFLTYVEQEREQERAERLAAKLRELGVNPDQF